MKKLLLLLGVTACALILNASEPKVGYIVQNETHKSLASSWEDELILDDGNAAFQIMEAKEDPEIILSMPQRNESVWINPFTNKYEKIMDSSLIVKTSDGKYRLIVGLFYKDSKESKKMYKALVDAFGKKNVKVINELRYEKAFEKDIYEIFKPENAIKKDEFWGIAG
jgi:hypothetical protein